MNENGNCKESKLNLESSSGVCQPIAAAHKGDGGGLNGNHKWSSAEDGFYQQLSIVNSNNNLINSGSNSGGGGNNNNNHNQHQILNCPYCKHDLNVKLWKREKDDQLQLSVVNEVNHHFKLSSVGAASNAATTATTGTPGAPALLPPPFSLSSEAERQLRRSPRSRQAIQLQHYHHHHHQEHQEPQDLLHHQQYYHYYHQQHLHHHHHHSNNNHHTHNNHHHHHHHHHPDNAHLDDKKDLKTLLSAPDEAAILARVEGERLALREQLNSVRTSKTSSQSDEKPNLNGAIPNLESTSSKTSFKSFSKPSSKLTTIMISTRNASVAKSVDHLQEHHPNKWSKRSNQVLALPNVLATPNVPINLGLPGSSFPYNTPVALICSYEDCHKTFTDSYQFNLHIKQHGGEKVYTCNWIECERLFSTKQRLNDHIRYQHTGERPYVCEYCKKAFSSSKNLRAHRLLHTGERPYKCDWQGCISQFRRSHHLTAHRRIHTGERPFHCQHPGCNLSFTKSDHAKRHYMTHFKKLLRGGKPASQEQIWPPSLPHQPHLLPPVSNIPHDFVGFNPKRESHGNLGGEGEEEEAYLGGVEAIVMLDEKEGVLKSVDNDCKNNGGSGGGGGSSSSTTTTTNTNTNGNNSSNNNTSSS